MSKFVLGLLLLWNFSAMAEVSAQTREQLKLKAQAILAKHPQEYESPKSPGINLRALENVIDLLNRADHLQQTDSDSADLLRKLAASTAAVPAALNEAAYASRRVDTTSAMLADMQSAMVVSNFATSPNDENISKDKDVPRNENLEALLNDVKDPSAREALKQAQKDAARDSRKAEREQGSSRGGVRSDEILGRLIVQALAVNPKFKALSLAEKIKKIEDVLSVRRGNNRAVLMGALSQLIPPATIEQVAPIFGNRARTMGELAQDWELRISERKNTLYAEPDSTARPGSTKSSGKSSRAGSSGSSKAGFDDSVSKHPTK